MRFILKFSTILLTLILILIFYSSLIGFETQRFNNQILKNINKINKDLVIELQKIKIILDPLNFNSNSVLGLAGIMDSYRQGNVVIVNAPGTGIADDKASYIYVPKMIKYYLNEEPILSNIKTYQLSDIDQKEYVIKNIEKMVVKRTDGSGGYDMLMGNKASAKEIEEYILKIEENPGNFISQPILSLSTVPCLFNNNIEPRCVDLRPFAVYGSNGIKVCPGGLSRVALKKGSLVVNSSQGGGSKDTWIIKK